MNTKIKKLIPDKPRILIQGITGKEGCKAAEAMRAYGTTVVAGVTPGKGGHEIAGIPVFNTVREAMAIHASINMCVQFVPPLYALKATEEVCAARIPFLLIGAEKVPVQDVLRMYKMADENGAILIGPSSVGMIVPRMNLKLGMIGGNTPERAFATGNIAVLSKSGGMTSETSYLLKKNGLGVSFAVGIGGDRILGSDFADILQILEDDAATQASVIFGEIGGVAEESVAEMFRKKHITKPIVAFIAGTYVSSLKLSVPFGHTGAILENGQGSAKEKKESLKNAGIVVAEHFADIPELLASAMKHKLS